MDMDAIAKGIELLRNVPEEKALTRNCICGDKIDILSNSVKRYSGVVNYTECLCPKCRKECAKHSTLVCIRCKTVMGYITPDKHKTGFQFEAGKQYHIDGCPNCIPNKFATSVLELERWCAERNIPTLLDMERVKENEEKARQADVAAAELKSTLN